MNKKKWLVILGAPVMVAVGYFVGHSLASSQGNERLISSQAYFETSDLHQMVEALQDLRADRQNQGLAKLDRLMLQKLSGIDPSHENAAADYRQKELDQYFEQVYGLAALNKEQKIPDDLLDRVHAAGRPPLFQLEPGMLAPDFEVLTIEGDLLRLADFRGRVVLITLFATWCSPCVAELNHLRDAAISQHPDLDVVVIGVDQRETDSFLKAFVSKHGYPFIFARDSDDRAVVNQYATKPGDGPSYFSIPQSFLVGRDGIIFGRFSGFTEEGGGELIRQLSAALTSPALKR